MSIRFICPHCQAETVASDSFAGQSGPCHTCGRIISVGRVQSISTKQSDAPDDVQPIGAAARAAWHTFVLAVAAATLLFVMPVAAILGLLLQKPPPAMQQQLLGNLGALFAIGLVGSGIAALFGFCLLLIATLLAGASADARRKVIQFTSLAGLVGCLLFLIGIFAWNEMQGGRPMRNLLGLYASALSVSAASATVGAGLTLLVVRWPR